MLYHFILVIFTLTTFARGADDKNHFTNPSSWTGINPVWKLGEEQGIAWKTTLGEFNISIWQQSLIQESAASQGNIYSKIHASDKVTNFTWVVQLYGFDLDYSNVFFLWMNSDTPEGFTSAYFNITEMGSTETKDDPTPSPSPTSNATASLINSTAANTSDTPTSRSSAVVADSALTATAKVALGVGLGIGLPVLAALVTLIWLRVRQPGGKYQHGSNNQPGPAELLGGMMQNPFRPPQSPPKEVPGTDPSLVYPELPGRSDL